MTKDWVSESERIAEYLSLLGYREVADAIVDAVAAGSTGTEILTALRWHFRKFLDSHLDLDQKLTGSIQEVIDGIDTALHAL